MTMDSKLLQQNTGHNVSNQQQVQGQMNAFGAKTMSGGATGTPIPGQIGNGPKICMSSMLEPRDDLDDRHSRCYNLVMSLISDKSEKEAHDALSSAVSKDPKTHEEVCLGFVVGILTHQPTINVVPGVNGSNGTVDQELPSRYYRDLTLVARDGLQCVLTHLTHLALEKYPKMHPTVKQQLMWLIRELIRNSVQGMDTVVWNLMRQIAGGDVSRNNLWLADIMVDILSEHRSWVEKYPFLVSSVVYTFLRLIEDHTQPQFDKLREKEVKFVVGLIRDKFNDVISIGRDLLRLLQYVAKIPEFDALWRDILYNPRSLSPTFSGFSQLMQTRTSRRFLQSRITPEMEKKLVFFTSQVRFGTHKRYQDWFQRQYLFTPESQSLRCDLIRFIVGVIHPTNELLCSDIIPRWAVIGWLLTTCTSQVAGSNAKLALFYDWLFFEPEKDNIMNIEPAILVMHHSMRPHPAITATLLDFLCRIIINFTVGREQTKVQAGIYNSLKQILDKRVLPSLSPLFDNPRLDKELRTMLRERYAPFCSTKEVEDMSPGQQQPPLLGLPQTNLPTHPNQSGGFETNSTRDEILDRDERPTNESDNEDTVEFSDEEDQVENKSSKVKIETAKDKSTKNSEITRKTSNNSVPTVQTSGAGIKHKMSSGANNSSVSLAKSPIKEPSNKRLKTEKGIADHSGAPAKGAESHLSVVNASHGKSETDIIKQEPESERENDNDEVLDEDIKDILNDLKSPESDCEKKCEIMDQLVKHVISEELDYEQCSALASSLAEILQDQFEGRIFPDNPTEESIEDSIGKPLFVLFRALCEMTDSDPHRGHILMLLAELYTLQPRIGYYLLYLLNAYNRQNPMMGESVSTVKSKANVYRDLCEAIDKNNSLDLCLVNDMRQCQEDDVNLFVYLLPDIYRNFTKHAVGNVDLLYLVVSCVDGKQVQTLVCHVVARDFLMFKKDNIPAILTASLGWETFEQYVLWQLISAHDLPFDCVLPLIPKFCASRHSEALTSVLLLMRQERPTAEVLKYLMAREVSGEDRFVSSCLVNWMHEYEDKLGELLSNHLCKAASGSNSIKTEVGAKRKRGSQNSKNGILSNSAELALSHLNQLRQTCTQYEFFEQRGIQSALQQVKHSCTESQKKKFMDLFALADSESEDEAPVKSSKPNNASTKSGDKGSGSGSGGGKSSNSNSSLSSKVSGKTSSKSRHGHHSSHGGSHHSHHQSSAIQKTDSSSSVSSKKLEHSESSDATSDSEAENEKPLKMSKKIKGVSKSSNSSGNKLLHNNSRKRGKISYKEMESTDESSDEDLINKKSKLTPKKRKLVASDSE